MAIAFVAERAKARATAANPTQAVSGTTIGNLLVICFATGASISGLTSVSDTGGNSWTVLTGFNGSSTRPGCYIAYALLTAAPGTITMTTSGTVSSFQWKIEEFSGVGSFDVIAAVTNSGNATTATTGTASPAAAGELAIAAFSVSSAQTSFTASGTGYVQAGTSANAIPDIGVEYNLSAPGTAAQTATMTNASNGTHSSLLAFFKPITANTYTKKEIGISPRVAAGPDAFTASETGTGISAQTGGGAKAVVYAKTGIGISTRAGGGVSQKVDYYTTVLVADSPNVIYPMDEAAGTTANDVSGNSRNGTFLGSPTLGQADIIVGHTSLLLDEDADYIESNASFNYGAHDETFEIWFKKSAPPTATVPLWVLRDATTRIAGLYINSSGYVVGYANDGADKFITGSVNVCDGSRHFLVVVFQSGTAMTIYVDAVSDGSVAIGSLTSSSKPLRVGGS